MALIAHPRGDVRPVEQRRVVGPGAGARPAPGPRPRGHAAPHDQRDRRRRPPRPRQQPGSPSRHAPMTRPASTTSCGHHARAEPQRRPRASWPGSCRDSSQPRAVRAEERRRRRPAATAGLTSHLQPATHLVWSTPGRLGAITRQGKPWSRASGSPARSRASRVRSSSAKPAGSIVRRNGPACCREVTTTSRPVVGPGGAQHVARAGRRTSALRAPALHAGDRQVDRVLGHRPEVVQGQRRRRPRRRRTTSQRASRRSWPTPRPRRHAADLLIGTPPGPRRCGWRSTETRRSHGTVPPAVASDGDAGRRERRAHQRAPRHALRPRWRRGGRASVASMSWASTSRMTGSLTATCTSSAPIATQARA